MSFGPSGSVRLVELADAMVRRRMVRHFDDRPVPPEVLNSVLRATTQAPSAGFAQGVDLLALTTYERRNVFWELASQQHWREAGTDAPGILAAPVIVVPVIDADAYVSRYAKKDKATSDLAGLSSEEWEVPYWTVDAAFAVMLMLLVATEHGLGALFFRLHADQDSVLSGLGVPMGRSTIGALALGFEAKPATAFHSTGLARLRNRRTVAKTVHLNFW
jgi:nitroreductase